MKTYLVLLKEEYIRDAQACNYPNEDIMSDNWYDIVGDMRIGSLDAESKEEAIMVATNQFSFSPEMLYALEIVK